MSNKLPRSMRTPRQAEPCIGTTEGWYYVQPDYVEVYARTENTGVSFRTTVRLTRKQLERALEIMDGA